MTDEKSGSLVPSIVPLTDERAKAVTALSNFGTTVVAEGGQLARYVSRVLGTIPDDAVGLVLGDPLHFARTAIAAQYDELLDKYFKRRGVSETVPVSPSLAIPLLRAAYDENRPQLQELWAALIAAAMDPNRSTRVRFLFIETLKRFDPLDALVLNARYDHPGELKPSVAAQIVQLFGMHHMEVMVSIENLIALNCARQQLGPENFNLTNYGTLLVQACRD